ncbi:MAG: GPR endopeptidase [Oscillospiraceae bacterium]|nr:GPR endopeptidase [Oscillospiraceae bacterium]
MNSRIRTDLAIESGALFGRSPGSGTIPGVRTEQRRRGGFDLRSVEILDARGEKALGKPKGRYITLELDALLRREHEAFERACRVLAAELRSFLNFPFSSSVLVAGLGNRDITPDAIGPAAVDSVMVTRHLRELLPEHFGSFRPVCAIRSGVLGTTGMESGDIISALCREFKPAAVIAVDALASRSLSRLCRTVQISDTGIVPGSGVGNARQALSLETLGVPVIAVGVPTVVDAAAVAAELCGEDCGILPDEVDGMIVTPRDIDRSVRDIAKLIGYSLNLALHDGLSLEDVDMFLS